uniref:Uncharacterized protein n=1 Tax=Quercus lobata TaxID=97700 RepID=A0A7N2LP45_QUELO
MKFLGSWDLGAPPKSDVPVITPGELAEADGKPAGLFYSTGSQGGGQETTPLTAITQLVHHGMIFVPIGYTFGAGMFEMEKVRGGSPYGTGTYAGDRSRQPSELELDLAFHQGKYFAGISKKLKGTA